MSNYVVTFQFPDVAEVLKSVESSSIWHSPLATWLASGGEKFSSDLPETFLNAILFGVLIGGIINWLRRGEFVSQRNAIAAKLANLHQSLLRAARDLFVAIKSRDADSYRDKIKPTLVRIDEGLYSFLLDYSGYFRPIEMKAFRLYFELAGDLMSQLSHSKVNWLGATDWKTISNENLSAWLFNDENFGTLYSPGFDRGALQQLNDAANEFFKSIGIGAFKRHKFLASREVTEAWEALVALRKTIDLNINPISMAA